MTYAIIKHAYGVTTTKHRSTLANALLLRDAIERHSAKLGETVIVTIQPIYPTAPNGGMLADSAVSAKAWEQFGH